MHYISAILFALSANMDNVAIGLAYGMKGVGIRLRSNLLIAFITSIGTLISMGAGATLTAFLPERIAASIGCCILIAMGFWFVATSVQKRWRAHRRRACDGGAKDNSPSEIGAQPGSSLIVERDAEAVIDSAGVSVDSAGAAVASPSAVDDESCIGLRESVILALALMVNNLGFGVGAKIAGLPIFITSLCTLFCSMLLLSGGVYLGKRFGNTFLGRYTDLISGCILIALGVYEFLI